MGVCLWVHVSHLGVRLDLRGPHPPVCPCVLTAHACISTPESECPCVSLNGLQTAWRASPSETQYLCVCVCVCMGSVCAPVSLLLPLRALCLRGSVTAAPPGACACAAWVCPRVWPRPSTRRSARACEHPGLSVRIPDTRVSPAARAGAAVPAGASRGRRGAPGRGPRRAAARALGPSGPRPLRHARPRVRPNSRRPGAETVPGRGAAASGLAPVPPFSPAASPACPSPGRVDGVGSP